MTKLNVLNDQRTSGHDWKWSWTMLFGLYVIWTGLWRCIDAVAYKPNALWFCMATGLIAIAASYLYRIGRIKAASGVALVSAGAILAFYLYCLIVQPEKDASVRVALAIVASVGELCVVATALNTSPQMKTD